MVRTAATGIPTTPLPPQARFANPFALSLSKGPPPPTLTRAPSPNADAPVTLPP